MSVKIFVCIVTVFVLTALTTPLALAQSGELWEAVILSSKKVAHVGDPELIDVKCETQDDTVTVNVVFILDASGLTTPSFAREHAISHKRHPVQIL